MKIRFNPDKRENKIFSIESLRFRRDGTELDDWSHPEDGFWAYLHHQTHGETNESQIKRMKRLLRVAVQRELTERQRECLCLYYFEGKKQTEIAQLLQLSKSTVSRHISAAKRRLRVLNYYL